MLRYSFVIKVSEMFSEGGLFLAFNPDGALKSISCLPFSCWLLLLSFSLSLFY